MTDDVLCPLITDYATQEGWDFKLRPFPAVSPDVLEKLYVIRKWPIEKDADGKVINPIPFKKPATIRDIDPVTNQPLVIKEFQKQAIHHLVRMPRFILGDAVGLGKTLDAIAAFAWIKERLPLAKLVVVTTKSTTYQWDEEVRRYSTLRPVVMRDNFRGVKNSEARYMQMIKFFEEDEHDIMIVKYDSMRGTRKMRENEDGEQKRDNLSEEIRTFNKIFRQHRKNIVMVLDECHKFKSERTQNRNLIFNLARFPERIWALTATVIKNGMDEFYSIATAIGIRPLGHMGDFHKEYCLWRDQYVGNGITKQVLVGYQNVAEFKRQMRPFFLGRSQRQVKEPLPKLTTVYHPIDLDPKQAKILLDELPNGTLILPPTLIRDAVGNWHEKERDPDNMMTQLSIQQLVANHWALIDRTNEKDYLTTKLSPKEEALLEMLDGEYRGEKVIVYTKFKTWIDRLEWLTENGHFTDRKFLRITGDENEKQRNDNKKKFQQPDGDHDLIVINAAGMEGINLQQAAHMILLDVPWSWGDLIQLVGRMVRMASPHSACTLHVMAAKGTIDEYAIETLRGKKGVYEKILGQSHTAGILDSGDEIDLESGMDSAGSEDEFRALLRAHCKKVGMKTFLSGDQIARAQAEPEYKMVFEKGAKAGRTKKRHSDVYQDLKWFLE